MLFRYAVFAFVAATAHAQIEDQARRLIQDVEAAARATRSWRAEGTQTIDEDLGRGFRRHTQTRFNYALADGLRARLSTDEDGIAETVVCDGADAWVHHGHARVYTKTPAPLARVCAQQLLPLQMLSNRLTSARITGDGDGCKIVRAEYESFQPGAPPEVRTLCIDPAAKVLRTERFESRNGDRKLTRITVVGRYERDPQFAPGTFTFEPPPQTELVDNSSIAQLTAPGGPVYRVGGGVTAPRIVTRVEPEYTEEARKMKYNGTVMLFLVVGVDGTPRDIKVVRAIGLGLDERAVETVRGWRFRPGMKNGEPVPVFATIEVSFRTL